MFLQSLGELKMGVQNMKIKIEKSEAKALAIFVAPRSSPKKLKELPPGGFYFVGWF